MTKKQFSASRREVLFGLGTIGVASVGAGVGSYAAFTDNEDQSAILTAGALDIAVTHETVYNGRTSDIVNAGEIDGNPGVLFDLPDVKPGDSGRTRFCFTLETNPAYLWLCGSLTRNAELGLTEPEAEVDTTGGDPGEGNGELADAVDIELKYADRSGNGSTTIIEGTLREVLARLSDGIPLDAASRTGILDAGTQQPFEPTPDGEPVVEPCLVFEWSIDMSVGNEIQTDSAEFGFTFHALQARHADGTRNPCNGGDGPDRKAISFVAFCVEDGDIQAADITNLTITETKDGGEPLAISWDSSTEVDQVVLKSGGGALAIENFAGGTSGTAAIGDGDPRRSEQTASNPCPDGQAVKFEFDDKTGEFEVE